MTAQLVSTSIACIILITIIRGFALYKEFYSFLNKVVLNLKKYI